MFCSGRGKTPHVPLVASGCVEATAAPPPLFPAFCSISFVAFVCTCYSPPAHEQPPTHPYHKPSQAPSSCQLLTTARLPRKIYADFVRRLWPCLLLAICALQHLRQIFKMFFYRPPNALFGNAPTPLRTPDLPTKKLLFGIKKTGKSIGF